MSAATGQNVAVDSAEPPIDFQRLERIIAEFKGQRGAVIPILQAAQDAFGYLPREAMRFISEKTLIPLQRLYGVATFYRGFHLKRRGKHIVRVCDGTACHVRGSARNIAALEHGLGIEPGQTTADYKLTLEIVYCLGSCGLAPVALVDEKVMGRLGPEVLVGKLRALD